MKITCQPLAVKYITYNQLKFTHPETKFTSYEVPRFYPETKFTSH